jgi:hypothetical protein
MSGGLPWHEGSQLEKGRACNQLSVSPHQNLLVVGLCPNGYDYMTVLGFARPWELILHVIFVGQGTSCALGQVNKDSIYLTSVSHNAVTKINKNTLHAL